MTATNRCIRGPRSDEIVRDRLEIWVEEYFRDRPADAEDLLLTLATQLDLAARNFNYFLHHVRPDAAEREDLTAFVALARTFADEGCRCVDCVAWEEEQ